MTDYEEIAFHELAIWQLRMQKKPSLVNHIARKMQTKINSFIPDKIHNIITATIRKMVEAVLFGAKYVTKKPTENASLFLREAYVKERIEFYRKTASAEGAITGAGGILMGFADFPLLIGIKMKLLFEIAALYGYDVKDYKERLYILHIFQLAFSSQQGRNEVYKKVANWNELVNSLPDDINDFDWRNFQQEYRDYLDIAKMAQLIPVIGAAVGAVVNYKLINRLGETAINSYRMRKISSLKILKP